MRWLVLAVPLALAGCAAATPYLATGVALVGIANQDALAFLKFNPTPAAKACTPAVQSCGTP